MLMLRLSEDAIIVESKIVILSKIEVGMMKIYNSASRSWMSDKIVEADVAWAMGNVYSRSRSCMRTCLSRLIFRHSDY